MGRSNARVAINLKGRRGAVRSNFFSRAARLSARPQRRHVRAVAFQIARARDAAPSVMVESSGPPQALLRIHVASGRNIRVSVHPRLVPLAPPLPRMLPPGRPLPAPAPELTRPAPSVALFQTSTFRVSRLVAVVEVSDARFVTEPKSMTANPVWSQDAELALPSGAGASEVARVSVWDKRVGRMKLMGMAIFPLSALGNFARKEMELHLEGGKREGGSVRAAFELRDAVAAASSETCQTSSPKTRAKTIRDARADDAMDANETTASMDANETTASMDANETTASMDANETTASMDANETTASSAGSSTTTRATVRSPSRDVSGSGSSAGSGSSPGSETPPGSGSPSGARAKTNESASTSDPAGGAPDASEETARAIVSAAESVSTSTAGRRAEDAASDASAAETEALRREVESLRAREREAREAFERDAAALRAETAAAAARAAADARAEADAAGRLASERAREMSDDAERVARRATEAIARARAEVEAAERARIATVVVPAPASLAPVRLSRAEDDAREGEENREEQTPSTSAGPGPGSGSDSGPGSGRPSTPRPRAVSPRGGSPRRPPLAPPTRARVSVEDSAMSRRTTPRQPPSPSRKRPSTRDDHDEELSAAATNRAVMTIEIEQARRFGEVFARAERVFASWSR